MYLFTDQMVAFFSNKIHIENVDIAFHIFPRNTSELCVCVYCTNVQEKVYVKILS